MSVCTGEGTPSGDHCCWLQGERCQFLVEDVDGRNFACGLRDELGSWDAVYADSRYLSNVKPILTDIGIENCGTWEPPPGQCCNSSGS